MILFEFIDVEVPELSSELFSFWLDNAVSEEGKTTGEITVIFCSDEYLLVMNRQYLDHDYYTDIITFDYTEGSIVSGDLFISVDRVYENAQGLDFDRAIELRRVCVHGVLHLCGYGDKSDLEAKLMRDKEGYYLDKYVSRET
ncbi:MAG: rRNA maturation RNase YbeY [Flavobacteriia bacterium]|jgi:probable rRNA maturation factor|nr:rRNA maturation RNase YbeY [Cryomorphaceae bacterium]